MKKTAPHQPYIFFTSSLIYTSDGRIGQFLLQLWLRKDDKHKTRVLNGLINALVLFWSASAQNNAPQYNFSAVIKFYKTLLSQYDPPKIKNKGSNSNCLHGSCLTE